MISRKPVIRVGASILTLYPPSHIFFPRAGMLAVRKTLKAARLDGVQLVPARFITPASLELLERFSVMSYEGDWRRSHRKQRGLGELVNRALFGSFRQVRATTDLFGKIFPQALAIDLGDKTAVEVSPENGLWRWAYLEHQPGVVFDTYHAPQQYPDEPVLLNFADELVRLDRIRLIHFQTRNRRELRDFLLGKDVPLTRMMRSVLRSGKDVIIELPPSFVFRDRAVMLCMLRQKIHEMYNQV